MVVGNTDEMGIGVEVWYYFHYSFQKKESKPVDSTGMYA